MSDDKKAKIYKPVVVVHVIVVYKSLTNKIR